MRCGGQSKSDLTSQEQSSLDPDWLGSWGAGLPSGFRLVSGMCTPWVACNVENSYLFVGAGVLPGILGPMKRSHTMPHHPRPPHPYTITVSTYYYRGLLSVRSLHTVLLWGWLAQRSASTLAAVCLVQVQATERWLRDRVGNSKLGWNNPKAQKPKNT